MRVCQQGMSDVELPMIKRRRIDLGQESEFTIHLADGTNAEAISEQ